jgi:alpha-tubulin suppressor-like RCC1 family protein
MRKYTLFFLLALEVVFFSSCDNGSGNIQGHIDLSLIEHLEGKDLGGTTIKIKGRNETAATDINGNFTLKNVEAGTFTLTISRDDWDTKEATVKVENGKITDFNETLDYSFGIIAGELVNMPSKHTLFLVQKNNESVNYQQTTSTDFFIDKIHSGTYTVTVTDSSTGDFVVLFDLVVAKNWYHYFTDIYSDEYLHSDNKKINFKKVSAGESHTCGISQENFLYCWGSNSSGQLGIGMVGGNGTVPTKISDDKWLDVSTGLWHTCGIKESGNKLFCWGKNEYGGLGNGTYDDTSEPVKVDDSSWIKISAGGWHTCGIKTDGLLYCWGRSIEGQVGNGRSGLGADENAPVNLSDESWNSISAGRLHTCGIKTDKSLHCWGDNRFGQLGNGTSGTGNKSPLPEKIGNESWMEIKTGSGESANHSCGIKADRSLYCWGSNNKGQLGNNEMSESSIPIKVDENLWINVTTGDAHTCGISQDNFLYCWGYNVFGQIGNETTDDIYEPTRIGNELWTASEAGKGYTCALENNGELFCWGTNDNGQIGNRTTSGETAPSPVADPI